MEETKIIELFNKYKDLRTKKPIEESMTLHSFKRAIKEAINYTRCCKSDIEQLCEHTHESPIEGWECDKCGRLTKETNL